MEEGKRMGGKLALFIVRTTGPVAEGPAEIKRVRDKKRCIESR